MRWLGLVLVGLVFAEGLQRSRADSWSQFRGPNATGRAEGTDKYPEKFGPEQNVRWKVAIPFGISSPVVRDDRVYLTADRNNTLLTICLDRRNGQILWEAVAPHQSLEKIHKVGSYAQPTPTTDGEVVVSLFGSSGLFCYDKYGRELWRHAMGPFKNDFGAGASPIIVGDKVILNQDHDTNSALMAFDKQSGHVLWRTDRSEFPRGYATPVIWEVDGQKQLVVAGTLRVIGYDLETGKEIWTVRGLARIVNMTPQVGSDGNLYLATWSPGGDDNERIDVATFENLLRDNDKNKNGTLEANEIPEGPIKQRFTQIDLDKDGHITKTEYDAMRRVFTEAQNIVLAIKPGGQGDVTKTHVLWTQKKMIPYVPSPLFIDGLLFMVKDGGLVNCLDAKTGKPAKQGRVQEGGYFSSPVAADGKIYLVSQRGGVTVLRAQRDWAILSRSDLKEEVLSTPALAGGKIYLRTAGHLYCFGLPDAQ